MYIEFLVVRHEFGDQLTLGSSMLPINSQCKIVSHNRLDAGMHRLHVAAFCC